MPNNGRDDKQNKAQPPFQDSEFDLSDFDAVSGNPNIANFDYDRSTESADWGGDIYTNAIKTYTPYPSSENTVGTTARPSPHKIQPKIEANKKTGNEVQLNLNPAGNLTASDERGTKAAGATLSKPGGFKLQFRRKQKQKAGRTPVKQDSRWRLLSGLAVFIVGLAAIVFLVQSNVKGAEVVVAAHDIPAGQVITSADLTTALISADPNYVTTLINSKNLSTLTDENGTRRVSSRFIHAHEPVVKGDVVLPSAFNRTGVPEGMVALSMATTPANASSRINSGDMVTLLYTPPGGTSASANVSKETNQTAAAATTTKVLVENVRVLDVVRSSSSATSLGLSDSSSSAPNSNSSSGSRTTSGAISNLTLLVTLDQAKTIETAKPAGTISVLLLPASAATLPTSTPNSSTTFTSTAAATAASSSLPANGASTSARAAVTESSKAGTPALSTTTPNNSNTSNPNTTTAIPSTPNLTAATVQPASAVTIESSCIKST